MTPEEVVETFAKKAEDFCWGADHVHYKGADEILLELVRAAVAAEKDRCLGVVARVRGLSQPWEDRHLLDDVEEGIREGAPA